MDRRENSAPSADASGFGFGTNLVADVSIITDGRCEARSRFPRSRIASLVRCSANGQLDGREEHTNVFYSEPLRPQEQLRQSRSWNLPDKISQRH